MKDEELADELIERLNNLIEDPDVREAVGWLLEKSIQAPPSVVSHPTLQVNERLRISLLGLLNGVVGTLPWGHPKAGWGFITAVYNADSELESFKRTE